jgi:hypothetical protein
MRKWIVWGFLPLLMISVPAIAGEAPGAAEATDIPAVVGQIAVMIMKIIGAPLGLLVTLLVVKLLKKAGIEVDADTEKFIRKQADSVIRKVDVWTAKLADEGKKPKSHEKLAKGVALLESIMKISKVGNLAQEKLSEIIEERLRAQKDKGQHNRIKEADPKPNPT